MPETQPISMSPYEIVLNAYVYFKATEMDQDSLIKVCIAAGCPNQNVARGILQQMEQRGLLTKKTTADGLVMYAPTSKANMAARSNLN